jgi:N-methylhydantoinase B
VTVIRKDGSTYVPPHLSKDQDIHLDEGDVVAVSTPGGGGFGSPEEREPRLIERDLSCGYYTAEEAARLFGKAER